VNLSAAQLVSPSTIAAVRTALRSTGLAAERLCLEITESAAIEDVRRSLAVMNGLKDLGVQLALDDFGTGYSSLSYLQRFPIDSLKIDRSFVMNLADDDESVAFVRSIISLAESLGLTVVAEGVETEAQANVLRFLGCTRAQGYLLGRPAPASDLVARMS